MGKRKLKLQWTASSPQNVNATSFLDLIPELRILIYEAILPTATLLRPSFLDLTADAYPTIKSKAKERPPTVSSLSLLVSCRQIHCEASETFYTKNIFRVTRSTVMEVMDLDVIGASGMSDYYALGGFKKIPMVPRTYAQFIRHIDYGPQSIGYGTFTWPMIECLNMAQMWPALSSIKVTLKLDTQAVRHMHEWINAQGSREKCVEKLVIILREVCRMQELRIPSDLSLEIALILPGGQVGNADDVTMFYDAVKRVKALKRL